MPESRIMCWNVKIMLRALSRNVYRCLVDKFLVVRFYSVSGCTFENQL